MVSGTGKRVLTMTRIPYIQIDEVEESIAQHWRKAFMDSALSHMNAHAQGFFKPLTDLNAAITGFDGRCILDKTQRELVSVRTSLLCKCKYMAALHTLACLGHGGANDAQVAAVNAGNIESDAFDDAQKLALKFTTEVVNHVRASDEIMAAMRETFTDRQIIEFIVLIGSRMMLCQIVENGGVALDDNPRFDKKWDDAHYVYPYRGLNGEPLGGGHGEK
jgi:AhpD family alkylhydroperoxidase